MRKQVVGGQGTGKSSLLKLLLDTADISPTATPEQRNALDKFLRQRSKRTESIETACVEICESRYDRVLLSVVDTPGLDFHESRALKLDRQVSGIIRYLDTQFADTLSEVSVLSVGSFAFLALPGFLLYSSWKANNTPM